MSVTYEIGHSDGAITWGDIGGTCDHLGRWCDHLGKRCDHLDGAISWSNGAIVWVVTIIIFSESLAKVRFHFQKVQLVFVSFYNYNIFKKFSESLFSFRFLIIAPKGLFV